LTVAVFVFLTRSTRAWIIPPDLRSHFYRRLLYRNVACGDTSTGFKPVAFIGAVFLAGTVNFFFVSTQLTEIGFFLPSFFELRHCSLPGARFLLYWDLCVA